MKKRVSEAEKPKRGLSEGEETGDAEERLSKLSSFAKEEKIKVPDHIINEVLEEYRKGLREEGTRDEGGTGLERMLREIEEYKRPHTFFEKMCRISENIIPLPTPAVLASKYEKAIGTSNFRATPRGIFSFGILAEIAIVLMLSPLFLLGDAVFTLFVFALSTGAAWYILTYPLYRADMTKIEAQDEMITALLYIVLYLRLNPSLEGAVNFASEHLEGPMGMEFKSVMWDLHLKKHVDIVSALGEYSEKWSEWNRDFVRSLDIVNTSMKEPSETIREKELTRALNLMLEGVYSRMETYSEKMQTPIKMIYSMAILLPFMALMIIPMVSVFLAASFNPVYLFIIYNVLLPLFTFVYSYRLIARRPGTFSINISKHPDLPAPRCMKVRIGERRVNVPILPIAVLVGFIVAWAGIMHFFEISDYFLNPTSVSKAILEREYEMINIFKSWTITLGAALACIIYFYATSFQAVRVKKEVTVIEEDFPAGIKTFGIYLGKNVPVENALEGTLEDYRRFRLMSTPIYKFWSGVFNTMRNLSMSFEDALFDPKAGMLNLYPSVLIKDVMSSLVQGIRKGSKHASLACKTISEYLNNIRKVNSLIHNLLMETVSSMYLLVAFIAPLLTASIAVMTDLIVKVLVYMAEKLAELEAVFGGTFLGGEGVLSSDLSFVDIEKMLPPTALQVMVGIYCVEIVLLLSMIISGAQHGTDRVMRSYTIAKNMIIALLIYSIVLFAGIAFFDAFLMIQG